MENFKVEMKDMERYMKIVIAIIASFSLLFNSISLWAQPFGIASPQEQSQHQILSSENGRFVFGQISNSDKDKFMLDTFTGRLWRIAETGKIGLFLTPISYRIADGEYSDFPPDNISEQNVEEEADR